MRERERSHMKFSKSSSVSQAGGRDRYFVNLNLFRTMSDNREDSTMCGKGGRVFFFDF